MIRNVRLQAVLFDSSMRFDKRKRGKEKKQEEGQVSLSFTIKNDGKTLKFTFLCKFYSICFGGLK